MLFGWNCKVKHGITYSPARLTFEFHFPIRCNEFLQILRLRLRFCSKKIDFFGQVQRQSSVILGLNLCILTHVCICSIQKRKTCPPFWPMASVHQAKSKTWIMTSLLLCVVSIISWQLLTTLHPVILKFPLGPTRLTVQSTTNLFFLLQLNYFETFLVHDLSNVTNNAPVSCL